MTVSNDLQVHRESTVSMIPIKEIKGFSPMKISDLPKHYTDELDELAVGFYESGHLCIIGEESETSKFLMEQFVSDFSRYSSRVEEYGGMNFYFLDDQEAQRISLNGFENKSPLKIEVFNDSDEIVDAIVFQNGGKDIEGVIEESGKSLSTMDSGDSGEDSIDNQDRFCKVKGNIKNLVSIFKKNESIEDDLDSEIDKALMDRIEELSLDGIGGDIEVDIKKVLDMSMDYIRENDGIEEENICIVTDSPNIATAVILFKPEAKVLLFGDNNSVMEYLSEVGGEWELSDAELLPLSKGFIKDYLYHVTHEFIMEKFNYKISREEIETIVNSVEEKIGREAAYHEEYSVIPPTTWRTLVKKVAGLTVFSQNESLYSESMKPSLHKVAEHFAEGKIISDIVKIKPVSYKKTDDLKKIMKDSIFGQDQIIEQITESLRVATRGLSDPIKPLRSMMFAGPTGVGKTAIAKCIAESVADEKMSFLFINMSEYSESHKVSSLFGAPPGYAGFDEGGILTKFVKENPRTLVLLDEVEKAHPNVWDSFLSVLDEGKATSSSGEVVDFSKTIVCLTTNKGVYESTKKTAGFSSQIAPEKLKSDERREKFIDSVKDTFKSEFLNRLDEIVVFNTLTKEDALMIVRKEINIISDRMKNHYDVEIDSVDEQIVNDIVTESQIDEFGAREVKRITSRIISRPLSVYLEKVSEEEGNHKVSAHKDNNGDIVFIESNQAK